MADPIRQRNIDVTDSLYNEFKSVAAKRGVKLREAFPDAMRYWIEKDAQVTQKNPTAQGSSAGSGTNTSEGLAESGTDAIVYSHRKLEKLTGLLTRIIASGNDIAIKAIAHNLVAFARLVSVDGVINASRTLSDEERAEIEVELSELERIASQVTGGLRSDSPAAG